MPGYKLGDQLEWHCGNTWVKVRFVRLTHAEAPPWDRLGVYPEVEDARSVAVVSVTDGSEFTAMLDDLRVPRTDTR